MMLVSRFGPALIALILLSACDSDALDSPDGGSVQDASSDAASLTAAPLEVSTRLGAVAGRLSKGVRAFLGIPFGAPPLGDRRLKEPLPAPAWTGTRDAKDFAAPCAQNVPQGTAFNAASSEDCLYLNVWAPATSSNEPLPVMVWTYGGAYVFGGSGAPYNGEALVSRGNIILVTYGYRLGPLGFLAHPALTAEAGAGAAPTNFGLLDQRLALQWVRDNIVAFGGDAQNVTLFGESAGANSVSVQLISEGSRGLFQRAIIESGLVMKPALTLPEAEAAGSRYAESIGCTGADVMACLRSLTPEKIMSKAGSAYAGPGGLLYQRSGYSNVFQPTLDGRVFSEQPEAAFAAGHLARVPILHGFNRDEGILFHVGIFGDRAPSSIDDYKVALANRYGESGAASVAARYPDFTTGFTTISSETLFRCATGRFARALAGADISNYVYRFSFELDAPLLPALAGKAFHSAEIPFVFGNDYLLGKLPPADLSASQLIMDYWTRFARSGDPNGAGAPHWPRYQADTTTHLELAPIVSTASDLRSGCDFWDALPITAP